MKVRKFKIKIMPLGETPANLFKQEALTEWKAAERGYTFSSEYDLELTFPNISWLSKIFSPERIRLIQAIRDEKPESIYQLAKLLGRAHSNVHKDVHELAENGYHRLEKVEEKRK